MAFAAPQRKETMHFVNGFHADRRASASEADEIDASIRQ